MIQWWVDRSELESVGLPEMLLNLLRCRGFQGVVKGYLKVLLASAQEAVLSVITEATLPKTCPSESNAFPRHIIFKKQKSTLYPLLLCLLLIKIIQYIYGLRAAASMFMHIMVIYL